MNTYCRQFSDEIFTKYDKDGSNVLERKELKTWMRDEVKSHNYMNRPVIMKEFDQFFNKVDTNKDGKIDRWELYEFCVYNMKPV
jgi:hypothetical protein